MRTKRAIINTSTSALGYFIRIAMAFLVKTCLIKSLGNEYNGIDSLFTSIISMLSIAELGIGLAITYNLYKPVKENDIRTITSIIAFYKKCYSTIAVIVLSLGVILLPFVPTLIGKIHIKENVKLIYLFFLIDAVMSYLLAYRQAIFIADQKSYIITSINTIFYILIYSIRCLILVFLNSFSLYVLFSVILNLIQNSMLYYMAGKFYPYLNRKGAPLKASIVNDITNKVKGLLFHKLGSYIVLGTDQILLTYMFNVLIVGYYSNYLVIINALKQLLGQTIDMIVPSVGNLLIDNDVNKNYNVYKKIKFLVFWLFSTTSILYYCLIDIFISEIWLDSSYVMKNYMSYFIALNFFQFGMRKPLAVFENAAGIFYENRFVALAESFTNMLVSIVMGKIFGPVGILIGTFISTQWVFCYDFPKYVWGKCFRKPIIRYIKDIFFVFVHWHIMVLICKQLIMLSNYISVFNEHTVLKFITCTFCILILTNIYLMLLYRKTEEFKFYKGIVLGLTK